MEEKLIETTPATIGNRDTADMINDRLQQQEDLKFNFELVGFPEEMILKKKMINGPLPLGIQKK